MLTLQTNLRIAEAVNPKMEELRAKLEDILNFLTTLYNDDS